MKLALAVGLAVLISAGCSKRAAVSKEPETKETSDRGPRLVRAEPLPALARQMLRDQMLDHGDDMESLLWTVLMLDRESAASIADLLGKTPKLARPPAGDLSTLNAELPPRFFDLQDELFESAAALSSAARKGDDEGIAKHFGELSAACVGCHALYLRFPAKK